MNDRRSSVHQVTRYFLIGLLCLATINSFAAEQGRPNAWTAMDPTYPVRLREFPQNHPDIPEIWIYSDKMSYSQGDEIIILALRGNEWVILRVFRASGAYT